MVLGATTMIAREYEPIGDEDAGRVTWHAVTLEDEILSVLTRSPEPGERIEALFRWKEQELMSLFAQLNVHDSFELRRRLRLALSDDPIAKHFGRMISERRTRLVSFLEGARRRAALRLAR